MGWANIYSAAYDPEHANLFDRAREYGAQSVWICASLLIGAAMLLVRGEFIRDLAYPIYGFVLLLLLLVLLVGREVNGAKAWFGVGGFGIQPADQHPIDPRFHRMRMTSMVQSQIGCLHLRHNPRPAAGLTRRGASGQHCRKIAVNAHGVGFVAQHFSQGAAHLQRGGV